ncbi:MAG TPA: class II fumarate hydratase [Polyangiaceae bacterium]|nr:class II fumarate hydratase [Polyangiaceae bacterium]
MTVTRVETDALGPIEVEVSRLWGAQTQRSLENFVISEEKMPREVIAFLTTIKKAAARVNVELGKLAPEIGAAITAAADEILNGLHWDQFPLLVWQTGSGTQSNMNVNEVIANRASEIMGGTRGSNRTVSPNDHVNLSQSSNDVFSTAMNLACLQALRLRVLPNVRALAEALAQKAAAFADVVKMGRTHLQDATPLTLGQEIGGWVAQLEHASTHVTQALPHLAELAAGGSAVGTGLNTHPEYAVRIAEVLSEYLEYPLVSAPNKFEAQAAHDAIVFAHGALKTLAVSLTKIANDVRWLASGPRCGLGEITIPANEPGSSIMPGKVNPTQCEALTMCAAQVIGNDVTLNLAGSSGHFELNVYKPVIVYDFLMSARLLADSCDSFRKHLVVGIEPRLDRIGYYVEHSLMLVTALTPHIGYDRAAAIAKRAHQEGCTLREAAVASGFVTEDDFDRLVRPELMLGPRP